MVNVPEAVADGVWAMSLMQGLDASGKPWRCEPGGRFGTSYELPAKSEGLLSGVEQPIVLLVGERHNGEPELAKEQ